MLALRKKCTLFHRQWTEITNFVLEVQRMDGTDFISQLLNFNL